MRGLVIDEALDLQDAELPNLDFTGTIFNAPVRFRGSVFHGLAWFDRAVFNEAVDFSSSVFPTMAGFAMPASSGPSRFHTPSSEVWLASTALSFPTRPVSTG